jgi:hypothetical protein
MTDAAEFVVQDPFDDTRESATSCGLTPISTPAKDDDADDARTDASDPDAARPV